MFSLIFVDRPKFAIVIALLITIAGLISINNIPVAEFPDITPPQVKVLTKYPGASADVVEQSVAGPIESQVNGVDGMLYMSSTSGNDGSYELTVTFEVGTDPDLAAVNVQNRVAIASAQLPADVTRQGVTTRKQSSSMLLVINLYSPKGTRDGLFLSNYASIYMQDNLARLPGVGNVAQFGALDYGMRVWMDPDRMTALGLTSTDIVSAISSQNVQAPAGQLGAPPFAGEPQFQYTLKAKGRLQSESDFGNIVIRANPDGSFVRIRDVARVELGSQSYGSSSRLNGKPAASIGIYQTPGANALEVADAVYAQLDELSKRFPPDLQYTVLYDTTRAVRASVKEVIETLVITFVLVVLVTFLFLGDWRSTLIPTLAIPVSLIGTIAVLYLVGYTANMITLFAIILAIGVVVDDSIVVVENVQRIMTEERIDAREATRRSMLEVIGPVIATTLVLLAVFAPVSFMPGITGELYRQFSLTICVAVVISSINALTLAPALCAMLLKPSATLRGPLRWFSNAVERARNGYVWVCVWMVRRLSLSLVVFGIFAIATVFVFKAVPTGFIPNEDRGVFMANVQLPDGASLARTEQALAGLVDQVSNIAGVVDVIAISGFSILSGAGSNSALMIIILDDWERRTTPELAWYRILGGINRQLASQAVAEAFAFPIPPIPGLGTGGGLEAQLQDPLGRSPQELASAMRSLVFAANQHTALDRVFSPYSADTPQLFLDLDRDKAQILGIDANEIFDVLQANLGSRYINDFNLFGKIYRVIIQAEPSSRDSIDDVQRLHVRNNLGEMVPVSSLVEIRSVLGPLSIVRYNQLKAASISGDAAAGHSSGQAIAAMEAVAATALPEGYRLTWTGTTLQEIEAGALVVAVFALALLFAYLFLVAQYESWSMPLAVVTSVVIAVLGALLPIWLLPFLNSNLYAQIGIVMLIGLASKSAILIVEFAKVRREQGEPTREAAITAARLRFRAVMMTALSFVLGVMPLLFATGAGAASRLSVGFVVVAGMLAATFVGIFFVPVLYVSFQLLRESLKGRAATTLPTRRRDATPQ